MVLYLWRYIVPDAYNYNENPPYFQCEKVIDDACAVVWVERFFEPGEITLLLRATPELLSFFWENEVMITRTDTDRAMFAERVVMTTSAENGDYIKITGKSAEGLTKRRVIKQRGSITNDNAAHAIRYYMQENIGSYWYYYTDADHQHGGSNPYCKEYVNLLVQSADDARITEQISCEPFGKNLSDFIVEICKGNDFGFKVVFDGEKLYYSSYKGNDRTLNQSERNAVVFSEDFYNLGDSTYEFSNETKFTYVVAGGSGTGSTREYGESVRNFRAPQGVGLNMRQKFINASGTSGNMLRIAAQNDALASRETISFSAEAISTGQFKYRTDYNLGDKVSVVNRYGISGTATVTGVVETEDENGLYIIPTLGMFDAQEYISPVQPERPVEPVEVMVGSGTLVRTFDNYGDMNIFVGQNRDKFFYALIRKGKTVPDGAFSGLDNVMTVVFQTNVRGLGEYAFSGCGLNSVDLSTVIKMGKSVFIGCDNLRNVTIPGNIKNIPERAFRHCDNLTTVQIENGIKSIGVSSFGSCFALTNIYFPDSLETIEENAFEYCYALKNISIQNIGSEIKSKAFNDCEAIETVSISGNIHTIANDVFENCNALTTITINKPSGSIPGAPWGAPNATVNWTG